MTDLILRTAEPGDVNAIETCITSAYADAIRKIADIPDVASGIEGDIANRNVLVAEEGGQLLGVIIYGLKAGAMMVFNLAVVPQAQGRGLARKLLAAAEADALTAGLSVLCLRTHRLMGATRAMYTHLGWQEVEETGNSVMMQKSVT